MVLKASRVQAILSLLSDSDTEIVAQVRDKLYEMGEPAVREIHQAAGPETQARREAERVLRCLQGPSLEERFQTLSVDAGGDIDLEEAAFALARLRYPDLQVGAYKARLDRMAFDLAPCIAPDDHPVRIIRTLNHALFQEHRFRGQEDYDTDPDPDNSYLNRVLDRKRGLPIALSVVYILLARRLELPIVGINMPLHFIVKYSGAAEGDILIDPFNRGQILTPNECCDRVGTAIGQKVREAEILKESTNRATLRRMMANLFNTYQHLGDQKRLETLQRLIRILHSGS